MDCAEQVFTDLADVWLGYVMTHVPVSVPRNRHRNEEFGERAKRLAPLIRSAAPRIEKQQRIPDEILDALHEAQLFRMMLPASCDGAEVDPMAFVAAIEELGKA